MLSEAEYHWFVKPGTPFKLRAVLFVPRHIGPAPLIIGVGFTVMVKVWGVPLHPFAVGVTVIVAVTGDVPALEALNPGILPLPLAASPIEVVLLVQL